MIVPFSEFTIESVGAVSNHTFNGNR